MVVFKISADKGVSGWGEPVVEGPARTVETAVHELETLLIGADPHNMEDLWQKCTQQNKDVFSCQSVAQIDPDQVA